MICKSVSFVEWLSQKKKIIKIKSFKIYTWILMKSYMQVLL